MMTNFHYYLLIALITLSACRKENEILLPQDEVISPSTEYWSGEYVQADYMGKLLFIDEGMSYQVSIGDKSASTDELGHFLIQNATVDKDRAIINVEFENAVIISNVHVPSQVGFNRIYPRYYQPTTTNFQDGSYHFNITTSEGCEAFFEDNSLVTEFGEEYSGSGTRSFRSAEGSSSTAHYLLSRGGMLGTDKKGELKYLYPYTGYFIEFQDDMGNSLYIKDDLTYRAKFRPPIDIPDRPETLPIWVYDEEATVWREKFTAEKESSFDNYWTDLDEFGKFMMAVAYDAVMLSGRVVTDQTNSPVYAARVSIVSEDVFFEVVLTDEEGFFRTWAPAGIPLFVGVTNECNEELYTGSISTLDVNTVINDIVVEEENFEFIEGRYTDCYGQPIPGNLRTDSWEQWRVRTIPETGYFRYALPCWQGGAFVWALDLDLENPTDSVYVVGEEGETRPTGVHLDCDLPYDSYMIYSIDGSEDLVLTEVNVDWNLALYNDILDIEFTGEIWGDIHSFSFRTWDYPEIEQEEEIFLEEPILEILNAPTLLGRFDISDNFEFEYLGLSDIDNSTIMFSFEGVMNSTIGADDITVSGIGVVKRQ